MSFRRILPLTLCASLSACGGGGGGGLGLGSNDTTANDAQVVANVKSSNIDFVPGIRAAGTWRWVGVGSAAPRISVYLPTPTPGNATEADYAAKARTAIDTVNARMAGSVVLDLVTALPSSAYIRISYGTSYVPQGTTNYQNYCANVSTGPNVGDMVVPSSSNGVATNPVWINLGNGQCNVTQDIVEHEFGHALGLANHFDGFGTGAAVSSAYWDTLRTLYANPVSTLSTALVVRRAG